MAGRALMALRMLINVSGEGSLSGARRISWASMKSA